jgi:hypothetical protein
MPQSTATLSSTIRKPDDAQSAINLACGCTATQRSSSPCWHELALRTHGDAPGHPDGGNCGVLFPHYPRINVI